MAPYGIVIGTASIACIYAAQVRTIDEIIPLHAMLAVLLTIPYGAIPPI